MAVISYHEQTAIDAIVMVYAKCGVCINNLDGGDEMYVFRLAIH